MIKVLHVLNNLGSGGAEAFIMNVYRNIDRSKIQFDFLVRSNENDFLLKEIESMGGKITVLPNFPKRVISNYKELDIFLKEHAKEYKAIHVHANSLVYVKPLELAKKYGIEKRIIHSHSTRSAAPFIHSFNLDRIDKWVTHRFACSATAGNFMFPDKQFEIIQNGIEIEKFRFSYENRKRIRESLSISNDTKIIGHIGRFTYAKNHKMLLDIFFEYHKINPLSKLMLVGEGKDKDKIYKLALQMGILNDVIFTGAINNVNDFLSAMDVFCFPSHYEGLGIVLIEAQAASLPCIASSTITTEADCGGIIYKSLEATASNWAGTIDNIIRDGANRDRSIKEKLKGFDIRLVAKSLEEFYFE